MLVAMLLYKDIQHITILIDRSPKIIMLAVYRNENLIHIPCITKAPLPVPDFICVSLTELQAPLANSLIGDNDAPSSKNLFNITEAQRKAEVQPNGMANDLSRIAIT